MHFFFVKDKIDVLWTRSDSVSCEKEEMVVLGSTFLSLATTD